ncbi:hypothetical protein [Sphingomonas gellani]|uniref:hypothetical protein n=1 Tax=Sphingomonas gellani TaxID=1166340 RepID=UPI001113A3CC|nr:hypothetical protein [Sphingomonas gellani]
MAIASQAAVTAEKRGAPERIGLLAPSAKDCAAAAADEVVVCAPDDPMRFRIKSLPPPRPKAPVRAETTLVGQVKGSVTADQQTMPDGMISRRAMVNLTLPF